MIKKIQTIDPVRDFGGELAGLENPARYLGGEWGQVRKYPDHADFLLGMGFPDIYEIGMSNTAIKLIYSLVNAVEGLACERVFSPWPDFEAVLRGRSMPLFTLESGIPLRDLDVLGVSIGFELSLSNALAMIDLGGIELLASQRGADAPLVIAGGPVTSNPLPYGPFFDGVIIGEAEACLPEILSGLRALKIGGASRAELVASLESHPAVWSENKAARGEKTRRAVWSGFDGQQRSIAFPVPSLKVIQDYASLEIMRGCPQGCRFCHAGIYYRPYRQKPMALIRREVADFVCRQGYRDISLASLSSGDYPDVARLYRQLNADFTTMGVSFALPSLKVNSFTLPLLAEMAQGKKSGLTFAIETASPQGQLGLNKTASLENTLAIMREAKALGWKSAKLYFMIGLPVPGQENEIEHILEFLKAVRQQVGINLNVSVGTFVPKPHTAFQWSAQLDPELAWRQFTQLKAANCDRSINISYQTPFYSYLEGIISRGDRRAGLLVLDAYRRGVRFDGWDDKIRKELWQEAFDAADWDVKQSVCGGFDTNQALPWSTVSLGISPAFLRQEFERSQNGQLTTRCDSECGEPCGACNSQSEVVDQTDQFSDSCADDEAEAAVEPLARPPYWQGPRLASQSGTEQDIPGLLFGFSKNGGAAFIPHLSLAQVLERALMRAGVPFRLSPGFSPHPVMELSQALSLGLESDEELCLIQLHQTMSAEAFMASMHNQMPEGIHLTRALAVPSLIAGRKRPSLGSLFAGAIYRISVPQSLLGQIGPSLEELRATVQEAELYRQTYALNLRADSGPSSLRAVCEPILGPQWQATGIKGRRLCLLAERPAIGEWPASEGDYFKVYGDLISTQW